MFQILIVDADAVSSGLLAQALSLEDCTVASVASGSAALAWLRRERADLLITEVHLPDMPAWQLTAKLRQTHHAEAIIAVTEDDSWETSSRMRTEGGPLLYYGLKPLDLRQMRETVRWVAERQHGQPKSWQQLQMADRQNAGEA